MENNFVRGGEPKSTMGIDYSALVREWLDIYGIPYNEEDFRYLKNKKDNLISIEVPVDEGKMLEKYKKIEKFYEGKNIPRFVKEDKVFITFRF